MPLSTESERPKKGRRRKIGKEPMVGGIERISAAEAIERIRNVGKGWNSESEKALAIPEKVFFDRTERAMVFSEKGVDALGLLGFFQYGKELGEIPDYMIIIYDTPNTVNLILCDKKRGFVFRDQVSTFHTQPRQWKDIAQDINAAVEKTRKGKLLVYDAGAWHYR
jgi:hypothetical protein